KGVVDDIDYLFGVHLRPIQEMRAGCAGPAIYNGAAISINGEIIGVAAHGARPHLGINVIEVAAAIVNGLGNIHVNPVVPATVKMTKLQAGGESTNIIPDRAHFSLDLRAQANEEMDELLAKTELVLDGAAAMFSATINWSIESRMVAAVVNDEAKQLMEEAIASAIGEEHVRSAPITPGAEDFHFYTVERPGIKATMLALGCDLKPGLHHPQMEFDHAALGQGVEILANVVMNAFQKANA
ncbi:MAG: amidohydrolase, partial [Clostridia bacterium]